MADIYLVRTLAGLAAHDDHARERLRRWPAGTVVKAHVRIPRALTSLKRYWALVGLVYENSEQFPSREALHAYLKIRAGHCTSIVVKRTGEVILVPDSIDFDTLGEEEFQQVWQRVCDVVIEDLLPGLTQEEINLEVQKLVGVAR